MHSYSCFSHFPDQPIQNFETLSKKHYWRCHICVYACKFMSLCGGMVIAQGFYFSLRLRGNRGHMLTFPQFNNLFRATQTLLIWKWAKTSQLFVSHDQTWLCGINKYSRMCVDRHYKNINLTSVTVLDSLISMTTLIKHRFSPSPCVGLSVWQPTCHLVLWFGVLSPRGHPQC